MGNVAEYRSMYQNDYFFGGRYQAIPIHPKHSKKPGLNWQFTNENYIRHLRDNRLFMGLASSPYVFSNCSNFIVKCANRSVISPIINYLDDFCIIESSVDNAVDSQTLFINLLRRLLVFL